MRGRRKTDAGVERSDKKFVNKMRDIPAGHTVILVSTGLDGISNNPKSWVELKFAYPHVKTLVALEEKRQGPAIAQGPDWYTTTHRRFLIFPLYQLILAINGALTDCNAAISFAACMNEASIKRGCLAALGTRGRSGDRTQQYERAMLPYLRCPRKDCGLTLTSFSFEIHARDMHGHRHRGPIWEKVAYNKRTHGSIEHSDLYIRRSEVSDEPVASIDTSCSSPSNVSLGPNTHQDTSDDELSLMDLDQNNSFPQLLVAQSKQEITHKSLPLKSQSVVSEKKKSRKEIDLTDETSNETKSKGELEARSAVIDLSIRSCVATFRIGKYSDRTINDDALFLTLLNNKWEKLRLTDQVKVFLFKAMKAKTESVIRDVDAETHSFQDSDLPLQHILRLIAISKISTCAKKDKIGAEIAQVRCDFELHNLVEEAGIAADPTEILKKGNPVDIRKAIYYNKLAKMNFLRIEGSLVI
ncbi:uncharacterized protein EAE97_008446 [Botrytis byssoidea]|uniref:Uncharacterized protein n=1 Tax=Botrytis byssoidea TaxID=139641 RepID=A0A9P5LTC2_9HELO|nr:uncharacterized protein EAE97_008446 [Botrytis byssoidea]KAF7934086.1 hypothetical protein EAE97_008446 [Botrytis byssoidea]